VIHILLDRTTTKNDKTKGQEPSLCCYTGDLSALELQFEQCLGGKKRDA